MDLKALDTLVIPAAPDRPAQPLSPAQEPAADAVPAPKKNSRSQQSRINGAHSKGPITTEGREKCGRSALKHGLTAKKHTLLDVEDATEFDLFLHANLDQFRPDSLFLRQLVDSLANINWRKTRLKLIETNYLNFKIAEHLGGNSPDPLAVAAAGTDEIAALVRS